MRVFVLLPPAGSVRHASYPGAAKMVERTAMRAAVGMTVSIVNIGRFPLVGFTGSARLPGSPSGRPRASRPETQSQAPNFEARFCDTRRTAPGASRPDRRETGDRSRRPVVDVACARALAHERHVAPASAQRERARAGASGFSIGLYIAASLV